MPIQPPPGIAGAIAPTGFTPAVRPGQQADPAAAERGADFGSKIVSAFEDLQAAHAETDRLAQAAATGDLNAVEDYMVQATQTQLATQLTAAVRNRAVESFNEIMRMQI